MPVVSNVSSPKPGSIDWYISLNLVHSVHNSGLKSFLGCRRRYDWIYNGHYYPLQTAKPLEFGVAFHAAMEKLYDPLTWHDGETSLALAKGIFTQTVDKQYLDFRRKNPQLVNDESTADYKERKKLGLEMLSYYAKHVKAKADVGLTPVKVEIEFEVEIKGPKGETIWCKCNKCWTKYKAYITTYEGGKFFNTKQAEVDIWRDEKLQGHGDVYWSFWQGLPATFGGRIDCLMVDQLGRYWIFDWKTAMRMTTSEDFLWFDSQITSYCWALWTLNIPITGFVYVEMKKAIPQEPEPNKVIRLGRRYSVSKNIETTAELYETTVKENDNLAYTQGLYDDFIAHLKVDGPKYHQRFQIERNTTELMSMGQYIYDVALDMTEPNLNMYRNAGKFNCQNCAFAEPCLAKERGEDYLYTLESLFEKRERHYYETEKSTDKREGE